MHCAVPVDALTPQEALRCPSVGGGVPRGSSTAHPPANPDDRKRFHVALASAPSPPPFPAFLRSHQCAVKISHNTGFGHHLRFELELQKYYMYKLLGSKAGSIMLRPLLAFVAHGHLAAICLFTQQSRGGCCPTQNQSG